MHKRMAVAVSGLVFGGATALVVGSAGSAGAATVTVSPHVAVSSAVSKCPRRGCARGRGSRSRNSQKVVVVNHNTNISRSSSNQFQRDGFFRNHRRGFGHFGRGFGGFGGFGGFDDFGGFGGGWGWDDDWE